MLIYDGWNGATYVQKVSSLTSTPAITDYTSNADELGPTTKIITCDSALTPEADDIHQQA